MRLLEPRLSRRFAVGTAAGLLASSLVFLVLYMGLYRGELASGRAEAAAQVNRLLQTSLENAMLKRDLEGLRFIVQRLGEQPGIEAVFITNPAGEVRFASSPQLLGAIHPTVAEAVPSTRFLTDPHGRDVLRSVNPVANRPACGECHGAVEQNPVNGVLYVDHDAAPLRHKARNTTLLLMGAGALIVLLNIGGGWWFIRRYVIRPVDHLSAASRALAKGDWSVRVRLTGDDELSQFGQTFNGMAEQLQKKLVELDQQREFLQQLIDAVPDGLRVITADYQVLLTNQAYRRQHLLGDGDGVGETCHLTSHRSQQPCPNTLITCPVAELRDGKGPVKALHRHHRADGETLDVEIYAAPMHLLRNGKHQTLIVESIRDLSKQIKYSQEQKLSELGKLATGVAHEIYNPLTSIRMALHALHPNADDPLARSEVQEYFQLVDREVDTCIMVTERLLRLGMPPTEAPELVDLGQAIEDTLSLVRWEGQELGIELHTRLGPSLRVLASDSEMRMVALNLIQNAFHAMPRGGTLTITGQATGAMVEAVFEDTGTGIPAPRLQRIFDPFYSRRADGAKGTGMGLAIVRSIVGSYGGTITVDSVVDRGSRFTVRMPNPEATPGSKP